MPRPRSSEVAAPVEVEEVANTDDELLLEEPVYRRSFTLGSQARDRWVASLALSALAILLVPPSFDAFIYWYKPELNKVQEYHSGVQNMEQFFEEYCFARQKRFLMIAKGEVCSECTARDIQMEAHRITWEQIDYTVCEKDFDIVEPDVLKMAESTILGSAP